MKKLMTAMAVIAVAAVVVSSPVEARWGGGGAYPGGGGYYDLTSAPGLNLTAEQATKLNTLRESHLREVKPLRDQLYTKGGDLRLLWLERTPDQQKIVAVQKELRALRDQLDEKRTTYRLESQKVLTLEQQASLRNYVPGRGYGMGKGYGHGRGYGWGPGGLR